MPGEIDVAAVLVTSEAPGIQREGRAVPAEGVTHLRPWAESDEGGKPCRATITPPALC
jgi:hypothetical protein